VLNTIKKSMKRRQVLDMIYISDHGTITKRWIRIYSVNGESFRAYCFLRRAKRTFKVVNVLALVPATKDRLVV